jgi:hypothetical protein
MICNRINYLLKIRKFKKSGDAGWFPLKGVFWGRLARLCRKAAAL